MRLVIVGAGNTATVLGRALKRAGHEIVQVYNRTQQSGQTLASELNAAFTANISAIDQSADIYLLAISDNALSNGQQWEMLEGKTLVHTAGSVSSSILSRWTNSYGVFYPLQSMRKEIDQVPELSLLITAGDRETEHKLNALAHSISDRVYKVSDEERKQVHIAAVFVSNFTNHLYTLAAEYCTDLKLDFAMLLPLIKEVASRLEINTPDRLQTGPAIRGDQSTIDTHLEALKKFPEMRELYDFFSNSIRNHYSR